MMRNIALLLALVVIVPVGCSDDTNPPPALDTWQPQPDFISNACSTCSGCCFGGNQCMPGTSVAACGFGGLTCQACKGTDQCTNGACVPAAPKCDASNCANGCCSSAGVCIEPTTTAACGKGGAACKPCAATEVCTAGVCESAGPKTYAVKIISAEVSNGDCGFG